MEELIYEYIFEHFEVKGGITLFFDGRRVYYDGLKKHLGDLFNLVDWEVDVYMTTCFYEKDGDFDYFHFMSIMKPVEPNFQNGYIYAPYIAAVDPIIAT